MESSIKATLPLSMAFPFFLRDVDVLLRAEKDEPVLSWLNRQGLQHSDQAERMRAMVWRKSIQNGCAKSIHRWARHHVPVELESWMEGVRLKPSEYLSSPKGWVGLNQTGLQLSLNDDNVMSILKRWTDDARQGAGAVPTYQQNALYRAKVANVQINQRATVDFALRCASSTLHAIDWLSRGLSQGNSVLEWRAKELSQLPERNTYLLAAMATSPFMMAWMLASGTWHSAWEPAVRSWQEGFTRLGRQFQSDNGVEYQDNLPMSDALRVILDFWPTGSKETNTRQRMVFCQQAAMQAWFTLNSANEPLKEVALPMLAEDL